MATIIPSTASDKSITWSSDNSSVATVTSNGSVKAISEGTATITAASNDGSGKKVSCSVTVKPPLITTAEQLLELDGNSGSYTLGADIDIQSYPLSNKNFYGILNGNGYTIKNATQILILENYGTIQNLNISNCNISINGSIAAGLVGFNGMSGQIINCSVSGNIVGYGSAHQTTGGIAGWNYGKIINCSNYAACTSNAEYYINDVGNQKPGNVSCVGGICGANARIIEKSFNCGKISAIKGEWYGIAGGIAGDSGIIQNCYNLGEVNSTSVIPYCGGIAGIGGEIENCVNIGKATAGIMASNDGYILNCYWLTTASSYCTININDGDCKCFELTGSQMAEQSSFPTLDFASVWTMSSDYPILK